MRKEHLPFIRDTKVLTFDNVIALYFSAKLIRPEAIKVLQLS